MSAQLRYFENLFDGNPNQRVFGEPLLHHACKHDNAGLFVAQLLQAGAQVEGKGPWGETPLMVAAQYGNTLGMSLLLAAGANVNATDKHGNTALHTCVLAPSCVRGVELLLNAGAGPNTPNKSGTLPLEMAALDGDTECIRALINGGANINAVSAEVYAQSKDVLHRVDGEATKCAIVASVKFEKIKKTRKM